MRFIEKSINLGSKNVHWVKKLILDLGIEVMHGRDEVPPCSLRIKLHSMFNQRYVPDISGSSLAYPWIFKHPELQHFYLIMLLWIWSMPTEMNLAGAIISRNLESRFEYSCQPFQPGPSPLCLPSLLCCCENRMFSRTCYEYSPNRIMGTWGSQNNRTTMCKRNKHKISAEESIRIFSEQCAKESHKLRTQGRGDRLFAPNLVLKVVGARLHVNFKRWGVAGGGWRGCWGWGGHCSQKKWWQLHARPSCPSFPDLLLLPLLGDCLGDKLTGPYSWNSSLRWQTWKDPGILFFQS